MHTNLLFIDEKWNTTVLCSHGLLSHADDEPVGVTGVATFRSTVASVVGSETDGAEKRRAGAEQRRRRAPCAE
jgi:hypothetical protein